MPSWFKEQCHGCSIALKLPSKSHTQIMGFAVCGVFHGNWNSGFTYPRIIFKILNDEKAIPTSEVDSGNASRVSDNWNVWISYMPFGFFKKMYHDMQPEDWAHIEGNLVMTVKTSDGTKSVRCGASIVYKEDLESIQHNRNCIFDYGKLVQINGDNYQEVLDYDARVSGNTYVYEEKSSDENLNLVPLRTRMSNNGIMERSISASFRCVRLLIS